MDTSLLIKTKKSLKIEAQKVAEDMGIPLTTVINSFLKQFVREKEITLSANTYTPTPYLVRNWVSLLSSVSPVINSKSVISIVLAYLSLRYLI